MTDILDILVEISDHDLPKLVNFYQEKAPWAPLMASVVHTTMKWNKLENHNRVRLFSPLNSWKDDGTIIIIIKWFFSQDIIVFTLDDNCTNLYKGLTETKRICYEGLTSVFYNVHERHVAVVQKFLKEYNLSSRVFANIWCRIYTIPALEARKFSTECPPDFVVKKLEPSSAKQINDVWVHRFPHSEKYIATHIEICGGYGLFLKSTNEMIAWIVKHPFGHFANLHTEEDYRRKGFGSLMVKVLSKEFAEEGLCPHGTTVVNNKTSQEVLEKLGFCDVGACCYTLLE